MLDALTKGYLGLHPAAAARTLARLDNRDLQAIFQAMPPQLAANVLEHMAPGSALRCLQLLKTRSAADILARIPAQSAVAALRLASREQTTGLLSAMPRPTAARLRLQLRYLTLSLDQRVADALRLVRRTRQGPGHILYVLGEQRQLAGQADLWDLLSERDRSLVQGVVQPVPVVAPAGSSERPGRYPDRRQSPGLAHQRKSARGQQDRGISGCAATLASNRRGTEPDSRGGRAQRAVHHAHGTCGHLLARPGRTLRRRQRDPAKRSGELT